MNACRGLGERHPVGHPPLNRLSVIIATILIGPPPIAAALAVLVSDPVCLADGGLIAVEERRADDTAV
jgi:hypothetical protein